MREVVFVDFARTPFVKQGGALRGFTALQLGASCLKGLLEKSQILEKGGEDVIGSVFAGSSLRSKETVAPVRFLTQMVGLPIDTEGHQVEMQDGSAITAINHAAYQIALGYVDVAVAGGMESYSTQPVFMDAVFEPFKGLAPQWLPMHLSPNADQDLSLAQLAAMDHGYDAAKLEEYAAQQRSKSEAVNNAEQIVAVTIPGTKKTPPVDITEDTAGEGVTAVPCDGAAFLLMMTAEKAKELGYTPYARWVVGADVGVEPIKMHLGGVASSEKALKLAGLTAEAMDLWACGTLSAAQSLAALENAGIEAWSAGGDCLSVGHAGGATGGRLAMTAMQQLVESGKQYAVVSCCCGGGHGTSLIIENLRR